MPIKHIAVLTSNMDSSKPDSTDMDGTNARDTATVGETTEHVEGGLEVGDIDQATPGSTCTHEDKEMAQLEGCKAGDKECDSEEDRETVIELACDIDKALCDGGDTVETVACGTDNAACNAHIVVDTVIVGDSASVGYHKQGSPKEDRQGSQVHINVQTITAARNEFNNSPVNGGTDSKRRSSGKSSKKDKPSPFKKKDSLPTKEILNPNSPTPLSTDRCDSSLSTNSGDLCRICQCDKCEIQYDSPLVSPCLCSGSLKYIHQACLQKWIKSSDKLSCELCMFEYSMTKKTKPFSEWERLDMTPAERRKVICSVTFHVIAITCVVWSLYVLIDRTTEEVEAGTLLWPFWTKLIVVAIGFTGGVVFMYVQCKMYLTLCKKWRMYNKVIIISSISEGQREKANQQGIIRMNAKQAQLEAERPDLNVFNIVNETESV